MKKLGFTLIELLVVIAIIAIITSIGVANLITAQKQARDAARREIIANFQSAYEQYYAENSSYPSLDPRLAFEGNTIPKDPRDPTTTISNNVAASLYCVCATMEMGSGNANAPSGTTCNWDSTGTYYCATNKQ